MLGSWEEEARVAFADHYGDPVTGSETIGVP
jgi:hypothetical protein